MIPTTTQNSCTKTNDSTFVDPPTGLHSLSLTGAHESLTHRLEWHTGLVQSPSLLTPNDSYEKVCNALGSDIRKIDLFVRVHIVPSSFLMFFETISKIILLIFLSFRVCSASDLRLLLPMLRPICFKEFVRQYTRSLFLVFTTTTIYKLNNQTLSHTTAEEMQVYRL